MMNSKRSSCPEFLAQKKTLRIGTPSKSIKLNVILAYPIDIHIYMYILMYILIHLIYHEWSAIGIGNTLHTKKSTSVKCPWNIKFSTRIDFVMHAGPSTLRLETRVFEDVAGRQKRIFRLWKSLNSQVSIIIIMIHDSLNSQIMIRI